MGFYKKYKDEITTLQLISQILGKIRLEYAAQEPQWAHVILDVTPRGFSTGMLRQHESYFEIETDLINSEINIDKGTENIKIKLTDGKSIREYYHEIIDGANNLGLDISINTIPQEMETTTPCEENDTHHHYSEEAAKGILKWFQLAWDVEQRFIAPIRYRKVYPGLFWGTFDVSCIIVYNEFAPFPDDSMIIERAAFDEHMVEFGFWLGDDNFESPTFFVLPYPFVEGEELVVDDSFPQGSYFSSRMAEYLYEMDGEADADKILEFFGASFKKSYEYLNWGDMNDVFRPLKMKKNQK